MENIVNEAQVLDLTTIDVNTLPELQGFKQKQEALVAENPFVAIKDNKTFDLAKKARTNLLKGRTGLGSQEKLIVSKLNAFKDKIKGATNDLIDITQPHEIKQQAEVKRWEEIKATEKAEKERKDQERKQNILKEIETIVAEWKTNIKALSFADLRTFSFAELDAIDADRFEEFKFNFLKGSEDVRSTFRNKGAELRKAEEQRIEDERLKAERAELEEEKRIQAEQEAKARAEQAEKQAAIDAENKRKEKEIAEREAKVKAKEEAQRKEDARIESEKQAKLKAEKEAKLKKEEETRLKALAPDKEKMIEFINSFNFTELPELKDAKMKEFLIGAMAEFKLHQEDLAVEVSSLI